MKNLLVFVDDEENILSGIKRHLFKKKDKWDIRFFSDSIEALSFIKKENVEIVVSDMQMPGMNGFELMEQVAIFSPSTIRIVLSGHTDDKVAYESVKMVHQFLAKPFNIEDVIAIVEKSLLYREIITNSYLKDVVSGMTLVPTLPNIYNEINIALNDEETTFKEIGEIVGKDIGLTASLLKIANSAFFGISRSVTNAVDATMYLGINVVKNLMLFLSVFSKLDQQSLVDIGLGYLWDHALLVALISKEIAIELGLKKEEVESAYTAGLLHDLGRLILATNFPDDYKSIIDLGIENETFLTVEEEIFGANHAMVGAYLATIWGLPIDIVNSIWGHHNLKSCSENGNVLQSIVFVSDVLYHRIKVSEISFASKILDEDICKSLGFDDKIETFEKIAKNIIGE